MPETLHTRIILLSKAQRSLSSCHAVHICLYHEVHCRPSSIPPSGTTLVISSLTPFVFPRKRSPSQVHAESHPATSTCSSW